MLRRDFLSNTGLFLGIQASGVASAGAISAKSVLDYGARPDGKTLCTQGIQRAIDEVFRAGGGLVYLPSGTWLTGGLELKSRVTLYLEAGSILLGSPHIGDYTYFPGPPERGDANGHHLLYARKAEDIGVCGLGVIDGQGSAYWRNMHRAPVAPEDAWKDQASYDYHPIDNLRPSPMLEFAECRNVRLSGITLQNAAGWTLRPVACETVVIDGIRIRNPAYGVNTDGLDITCSRNVFVSNCDIDTGDDAICIKSENPYGDALPTKNITITNCVLSTSCNGLKLGTASQGAFENIVFSNSVISSGDATPMNARVIGGVNIEVVDGGSADGILVSNIRMENTRTPIFLRMGNRRPVKPGNISYLRNVLIQGIHASGAVLTNSISGSGGLRPTDIAIGECCFRTVEAGKSDWNAREIPEVPRDYPESRMMGRLPAYGFYIRHADRIRLSNLTFLTDAPDERPAIVSDDASAITLSGLTMAPPAIDAPLIDLRNTRDAWLSNFRAPRDTRLVARVSGAQSSGFASSAISIHPKQQLVEFTGGATAI